VPQVHFEGIRTAAIATTATYVPSREYLVCQLQGRRRRCRRGGDRSYVICMWRYERGREKNRSHESTITAVGDFQMTSIVKYTNEIEARLSMFETPSSVDWPVRSRGFSLVLGWRSDTDRALPFARPGMMKLDGISDEQLQAARHGSLEAVPPYSTTAGQITAKNP
jgi:hypothetical protein